MNHVVPVSIVFAAALNSQIIEVSEAHLVEELEVLEICSRVDAQSPIETMVQLLNRIMEPIDRMRVAIGYALTYPSSRGQLCMAMQPDTILIANFDSTNAFLDLKVGYKLLDQTYRAVENLYNMVYDQTQLIDALSNPLSPLLSIMEDNQHALIKAKEQQEAMVCEVKQNLRKRFQVYPIP
jgi:hypothetical protein